MSPCNCGKGRGRGAFPPPAGLGAPKRAAATQPAGLLDPAKTGPRPVRREYRGRQTFTLRTPDGATLNFGSRLEAEAARARRGDGTVTP